MLKELKGLLQGIDAAEPLTVGERQWSLPKPDEPASVAQPAAPPKPSSYIYDTDPEAGASLLNMLGGAGVEGQLFTNGPAFLEGLKFRAPTMVFLDVSREGDDAIDALFALGEHHFGGGVQLMGAESVAVMETVRRMGQRHSLEMLPALRKPVNPVELRQALRSQDIALAELSNENVTLSEALKQNWIEFWFQPKIDMHKRQVAGVETFARLRHPELGMLPPATFMPTASEDDLMLLAERSIIGALGTASALSQLGINLRLAVNVPVNALINLPIRELVRTYGPNHSRWPGLLLDVTEGQIADDYDAVARISAGLSSSSISLAIDDFGRGRLSPGLLKNLPFAELKLDRAFVSNCAAEPSRASVCRSVIELAHHLGCVAVAIGVEKMADFKTLMDLGCDLGQGYLFGPPMPAGELVDLLRERAVAAPKTAQSAAAARAAAEMDPAVKAARARMRRARWD